MPKHYLSKNSRFTDIFKYCIRSFISYFPPVFYKRMLSISILAHEYPNAFKGKNHLYKNRSELWNFACEEVGRNSKLIYVEFGVYQGKSIKYFSENFVNQNNKFIGLDTFEGLPEEWDTANVPIGTYSTFGEIPDINDERVFFYKGLCQDTSEKWLKDTSIHDESILFCHFDADLYSATLFGLTKIGSLKKPFFCIFDEFFGDEARALEDFKKSYLFKSELIASADNSSNSINQITNRHVFFKISPI